MEGGKKTRDIEKSIERISQMWPTKGNVSLAFLLNCMASDSPEVLQNAAKKHLIEMLLFAKKNSMFHYINYTDFIFFFLKDEETRDMVMKANIYEVLRKSRFPF